MALRKWIKTNTQARIYQFVLPSGENNIVVLDASGLEKEVLKKIGFHPPKNNSFIFREGGALRLNEMREAFPNCEMVEIDNKETLLNGLSKPKSDETASETPSENGDNLSKDQSALLEASTQRLIGTNYLGQEVFEDAALIRFIKATDASKNVGSEAHNNNAIYLRRTNDAELSLCADAFVMRMLAGERFRESDLLAFANDVMASGDEKILATDSRAREMQEAIEASIFKVFSSQNNDIDALTFAKAIDVENNQPKLSLRTSSSIALQQYSTPITMALAAQHILGDLVSESTTVLEPSVGNGSLVSHLKNADVTAYEIDINRAKLSTLSGIKKVVNKDFTRAPIPNEGEEYDVVIGNPPFGGLPAPVIMSDMKVTRLDQLFLMKSLAMRKAGGATVFIIGGDYEGTMTGQAGKILGGSKNLFNYLADNYRLKAVELDGSLYAKQGASFPVRMLVIGAKYTPEEAAEHLRKLSKRIDLLPVIGSRDELWGFANEAKLFIEQNVSIPLASKAPKVEAAIEGESPAESSTPLQSIYQPSSKIGESSSLIPSHLEAANKKAMDRLVGAVGDVDEFVASCLNKKVSELSALYTPEQVDAIALAIWNIQRGRGLILADETGQGKGRILAAVIQWASINKESPMFLTEKGGLFSSIYRDVVDSGGKDAVTPLILNNGASIIDMGASGEVLYKSATAPEVDMIINDETDPSTTIMATYSQFNRPAYKLERAKWIAEGRHGGVMILDEAHNAAGDSNVGKNIAEAVDHSNGVIYSSATFAKGAANFGVYKKAFPPSVNLDSLTETLKVGGEPLLEILSAMLAEDGTLIRRESDMSQLTIESHTPSPEILKKNRDVAIAYSVVMQAMSEFSGEIEQFARSETNILKKQFNNANKALADKKGNSAGNVGVGVVSFGSRLATLNRQLLLAMAVPSAIEYATERVAAGEKPVFALEHTMESLAGEILNRDNDADEVDFESDILMSEDVEVTEKMDSPLQFRDLLNRTVTRMLDVSMNNGYGVTKRENYFDLITRGLSDEEKAAELESKHGSLGKLRELIASFPDLSASPIDDINNAMAAIGLKTAEISGRQTRIVKSATGEYVLEKMPKLDKATIEYRFNSGIYDSLVLSRAGSTGISLHNSIQFEDKRRRVLIEVQSSLDVVQRKQMFGRVNRRGQVSIPRITTVTSGLPVEVRTLAMQNKKLRALSANTRSNRDSEKIDDTPDIINAVGEMACQQYLLENPSIAQMLRIDLAGSETQENFFVNKLTGRISLLHPDEQERIYGEIFANYHQLLKEMSLQGINPFEVNSIDAEVSIIESFEITKQTGDSVFDSPVTANLIEWTEKRNVIRGARALDLADAGYEAIKEHPMFNGTLTDGYLSGFNMTSIGLPDKKVFQLSTKSFKNAAKEGFDKLKVQSLPEKYFDESKTIGECIKHALSEDCVVIKGIDERQSWFDDNLKNLMPYHVIQFTHLNQVKKGLIVGVKPAKEGEMQYLGRWSVSVVAEGVTSPLEISFNQLKNDEKYESSMLSSGDVSAMISVLNSEENTDQERTFKNWVMTGNLFKASEIAAENGLGKAGFFTDKSGVKHRAVLCNHYVTRSDFSNVEQNVATPELAAVLLMAKFKGKQYHRITLNDKCYLALREGALQVVVGGSKTSFGDIYLDPTLIAAVGEFSGNRSEMAAEFKLTEHSLKAVMKALYRNNIYVKVGQVTAPEARNVEYSL